MASMLLGPQPLRFFSLGLLQGHCILEIESTRARSTLQKRTILKHCKTEVFLKDAGYVLEMKDNNLNIYCRIVLVLTYFCKF